MLVRWARRAVIVAVVGATTWCCDGPPRRDRRGRRRRPRRCRGGRPRSASSRSLWPRSSDGGVQAGGVVLVAASRCDDDHHRASTRRSAPSSTGSPARRAHDDRVGARSTTRSPSTPSSCSPRQHLSGDEQKAFAARFGPLELISGDDRADADHQPPTRRVAAACRRPRDGDPARQRGMAHRQLVHAGRSQGVDALGACRADALAGRRSGPTCALRTTRSTTRRRRRSRTSRAFHSIAHSQAKIGHTGDTEGLLRVLRRPGAVAASSSRSIPRPDGRSLFIGRHAYGIPGLSEDESERLLDELLEHRLPSTTAVRAPLGGRRPRRVGQPLRAPPCPAVGPRRASSDAAHADHGRPRHRGRPARRRLSRHRATFAKHVHRALLLTCHPDSTRWRHRRCSGRCSSSTPCRSRSTTRSTCPVRSACRSRRSTATSADAVLDPQRAVVVYCFDQH